MGQAVNDGRTVKDAGARELATWAEWDSLSETEHFVQFYETDSFLLDSLSGFIAAGLRDGDACVVLATREHREGLERRLKSFGLDPEAAVRSGQFICMDAAETLSRFMFEGMPEPALFHDVVVEGVISRASERRPRVRIFGEMVASLWAEGNHDAALRLEELWNELHQSHSFMLFCAYPMHGFGGEALGEPLGHVCAAHSRVVPAESYTALADPDERLRAVIRLQQKATQLQSVTETLQEQLAEREQLLAREQAARADAEAANRIKDEFLANVSHELRTPLTAILGWTHMLRTGQLDGEAAVRGLATVERNARAQAQIVEDLLDVSRIISGNLYLDVRPANPSDFIEAAVEAVRPAAEARGVRLQKVIDTSVSAVACDPARMQQVVWNLLSNAIKFTPRGGRVRVKREGSGSHVRITISDDGDGIRSDFLPFVFDRFRQADMSSTRLHGGLGLGLSIVKHLVELHGGTVTAESEGAGAGSTFTVTLPLVSTPEEACEAACADATTDAGVPSFDALERLDGVRVLVVEDEPDTRELLKVMLEQCGAQVTTAPSAAEAFALLEESPPDVLVSDIGLPGEDGYEFIGKVRALPAERGGRVPAIALTAYARSEDRLQALRAGFQMHVSKPVELAELVTVAASLVRRDE
ncbi:MAG TPA: ATP-binding protein [Pyrinomonadaceae bacterium]|nr:ATP-binding protein [Pyrinomonadaceae bacterium]